MQNLVSLSLLHNLNQQSLYLGSTEIQILLAACQILPMNCLSVFNDFVGLALKGLTVFFGQTQITTLSLNPEI